MKRGCEITVSMEKEDLSFKMNERSSFLLPFRRGYIAKGEVYQVYINAQMKELKPLNVSFPHSDGYTSDKLLLWQYIPFGKGVKKRTFRSF